MTIKELLKRHHAIEIDLLLSHILGKPKEFLYMNPSRELTRKQTGELTRMVKRRMAGEPMAYILGYKDFYGLRFKVNKDALVPRPETEWVVERVMNYELRRMNGDIRILDIGTGSGAIIISLAKAVVTRNSLPVTLFASDISPAALAVAKQNAKYHHVKIKFIKSDLLKNIKFTPDIIIANLPYLPKLQKELKFEPQKALYTKEKGLFEIRRLLEQIAQRKIKTKLIYLEFDPRQKADLNCLIKKYLPKGEIKFHKDFNNFWRYAEVKIG